jgi:tRNA pseudouridine32 synthase/23S rRNA pseudouridine746 synthase
LFSSLNNAVDGLQVLYVDASLLVLNKPSGLLCVPGRGEDKQDCLSRRAQQLYPDTLVVHRLDMSTSGLLLMARGLAMQRALSKLFETRQIHKRYIAIVNGKPIPDSQQEWNLIDLAIAADWLRRPLRVIDAALGKPSQTRWKILSHDTALQTTRLELEPVTGRSHQLRLHLQAIGHPILGDALYAPESVQALSTRLLLHASALSFVHPETEQSMAFACQPVW